MRWRGASGEDLFAEIAPDAFVLLKLAEQVKTGWEPGGEILAATGTGWGQQLPRSSSRQRSDQAVEGNFKLGSP